MEILSTILWPIIWVMDFALRGFRAIFGSYGVAIILLSAAVRIAVSPLSGVGRRYTERDQLVQERMQAALADARARYRGRERFEKIDAIYAEHGYHPIHSMASLLPLMVQIPFLLAALLLLVDEPALVGESFLFIDDLSRPDGLLPLPFAGIAVNVLPLLLTAVAVLESIVAVNSTRQTRTRFLIVALVLVVLIYPLPAAVCLYWLASNVWSLLLGLRARASRAGGGKDA